MAASTGRSVGDSGVKMKSIEEEMSRFEEEILSLTQDPAPSVTSSASTGKIQAPKAPGFQPGQTQSGTQGQGIPRRPGFQPRQMGRPGGASQRPRGPAGFVPHQLRVNQRPGGPPRFHHLPPPPPPPPHQMGPMPGMDGPMGPPHMNQGPPMMGGPMRHPPMPPFGMMPPGMPPGMGGPHGNPVTLSAKPTTYASKPVLNKKKKIKKEKSVDAKEKDAAEAKDSTVTVKQEAKAPAPPELPSTSHVAPHPTPKLAEPLPTPPMIPQAFSAVPPPVPHTDLSQVTEGGAYELGSASEPLRKKDKKKKFLRTAAGLTWEDDSLTDWDPNDFRLFAGDLGNEVTEDTLTKVFGSYPSYLKCKIIRDKRTNKTKGYGFVSFKDPRDFVQAMKDWNGKYVGNRPIKLLKSTWKDRDISLVKKKQKEKDRLGLR